MVGKGRKQWSNVDDDLQKLAWERYKSEVAGKLGLKDKIDSVGWDSLTAAECGKIGGKLATRLGDNLLRKILQSARNDVENTPKVKNNPGIENKEEAPPSVSD